MYVEALCENNKCSNGSNNVVIRNWCTVEACSQLKDITIGCVVRLLICLYVAVMLLSYSKFSKLCKIYAIRRYIKTLLSHMNN